MSEVDSILSRVDMEVPRTPQALCDWVNSKASELSETDKGKRFARSGALLPKKLWEEVRPFGLFAFLRYGPKNDVRCAPNLSNENYDGRIDFDGTSTSPIYVEVTYAKDGHDEGLRLEVLSATGSVNALGTISVSGTKTSGRTLKVANEAVDHNLTRGKGLDLIRERIIGKSRKTYGQSHILVVVVDDYLAFRTEDDRVILQEYARSVVDSVALDFRGVFLLGSSGNYLHAIRDKI